VGKKIKHKTGQDGMPFKIFTGLPTRFITDRSGKNDLFIFDIIGDGSRCWPDA
jgi:hypothetical protein